MSKKRKWKRNISTKTVSVIRGRKRITDHREM